MTDRAEQVIERERPMEDILRLLQALQDEAHRQSEFLREQAHAPGTSPQAALSRLNSALEFNCWAIIFKNVRIELEA